MATAQCKQCGDGYVTWDEECDYNDPNLCDPSSCTPLQDVTCVNAIEFTQLKT